MDARSVLLAMLPVGLTLINYAIARDLIWGIFLGNKSKKSAAKIKAEQKGWAKFTQNYMTPYIKKYEKEYNGWKIVRSALIIAAIAQLVLFTLLVALDTQFWIVAIICGVIIAANIALFVVMMNQTQPSDNKHDRKGSPWKFEQ